MATSYQMGKSSKSHKSLEPTKEQAKNYVDKPKMTQSQKNAVRVDAMVYHGLEKVNMKNDAIAIDEKNSRKRQRAKAKKYAESMTTAQKLGSGHNKGLK